MNLISWNVNGLRACLNKGFMNSVLALNPDILCLQETKMQEGQAVLDLPGYTQVWNSAEKKGYSGTAVFTRVPFIGAQFGMGIPEHDTEGRVIALSFPEFTLVNVYTPNSQDELRRLSYRMRWEDDFRAFLHGFEGPVVVCGDMNVAHQEIDLKNPRTNRRNAGFTDEERGKMTELLTSGFTDTFRHLHSDARDAYTWWSYRMNARERNTGWRIDYFLISSAHKDSVKSATIHADVYGSDHCPVGLTLNV